MLKTLVDYRTDVIVRKGIYNGFSFSAEFDKLGLLEHSQLVGDGRKAHIEKLGNVANAHLRFKQNAENFKSCAVAENLEKLGKVENDVLIGHYFVDLFDNILVNTLFRAKFRIVILNHICTTFHLNNCSYVGFIILRRFLFVKRFYDFFKNFFEMQWAGSFRRIYRNRCSNNALFRMLPSRAALCPSPGSVKHYVFLCVVD